MSDYTIIAYDQDNNRSIRHHTTADGPRMAMVNFSSWVFQSNLTDHLVIIVDVLFGYLTGDLDDHHDLELPRRCNEI
jgi:hypothetical protein